MEPVSHFIFNWKRASGCDYRECVEVVRSDGEILVRDSKSPEASPQRYSADEWVAFVDAVKAGEFDDL